MEGKKDVGTTLELTSEVCFEELAKFTMMEGGQLKNVESGLCIRPKDGSMQDKTLLELSDQCEGDDAKFEGTAFGSIRLRGTEYCIQPVNRGESVLGIRSPCDDEESKFIFLGESTLFTPCSSVLNIRVAIQQNFGVRWGSPG